MEQPDWRDRELARVRQENQSLRARVRELESWLSPHIDLEKWSSHVEHNHQPHR
jgi:hypothetical protein